MKKFTLLFALAVMMAFSMQVEAQWSNTGNNVTTGTLRIGSGISFSTKKLIIKQNSFDHIGLFENIKLGGNGLIISADVDPLRVSGFGNLLGNYLIVKGNGSVGINTTNPSSIYKLDVVGNIRSSATVAAYTGSFNLIYGTLLGPSDRNLKKDIKEDYSSFEALYGVKTYNYKYKNDPTERNQFGVMAQDVQKVYPELVHENDKGELAVNYTSMIPLLIRAVQDQKQTIESLQEELTALKSKITENGELAELLDMEGDKMTIFPNPSSRVANISLKGTSRGSVSLEVINLNGEVVQRIANQSSKSAEINTSDMLKGVYFVRYIRDGKVLETKRLLIEK